MDKRLLEIYVKWEDKLEHDEWYFNNAFYLITIDMSPEEAFHYIPNVIEVLIKLNDDFLIWETIYFLIELYYLADTTQIHPCLTENWSNLTNHIKNYKDAYSTPFNELKRYLRVSE